MENQQMEQPTEQAPMQGATQNSSGATAYIIGAVVVIVLVVAYFLLQSPANDGAINSQALDQTAPAFTEGNTTADISTDLDMIPDTSAVLEADASASASEVQSI